LVVRTLERKNGKNKVSVQLTFCSHFEVRSGTQMTLIYEKYKLKIRQKSKLQFIDFKHWIFYIRKLEFIRNLVLWICYLFYPGFLFSRR